MDVIQVPAPPKQAFNKHRRISDLIKAQIAHLKHLEEKLPAAQRAALPHHAIVTENEAAKYIAAMTRLLRGEAAAAEPKKRVLAIRSAATIDLAAASEPKTESERPAKTQPKKSTKAKAASRGRR